MTLNEKFVRAVEKHIPAVNLDSLRRRLAPIDIDARYTAACMAFEDARDHGTTLQAAQAKQALKEVSVERSAIRNTRK